MDVLALMVMAGLMYLLQQRILFKVIAFLSSLLSALEITNSRTIFNRLNIFHFCAVEAPFGHFCSDEAPYAEAKY